jgi:hypothetical protein
MFFLGIAGPLIPYFLMTGILIAFTLEVSMEKLRKPEKESPDHHFYLTTKETETTSPEYCYHFCTQLDQTHQQDLAKNINHLQAHLPPPGLKNGRKIICLNDSLPVDHYINRYFGLSPPYRYA